jgi:hypothetical protein
MGNVNVNVTGVSATASLGSATVLKWTTVSDAQTITWTEVNDAQSTGWSPVSVG